MGVICRQPVFFFFGMARRRLWAHGGNVTNSEVHPRPRLRFRRTMGLQAIPPLDGLAVLSGTSDTDVQAAFFINGRGGIRALDKSQ